VIALKQLRETSAQASHNPGASGVRQASSTTSISYADQTLPPPIHARDYERSDMALPRNRGHRLAWIGIVTSVLSLLIAGILYALPLVGVR
jgi:hypothetical protein